MNPNNYLISYEGQDLLGCLLEQPLDYQYINVQSHFKEELVEVFPFGLLLLEITCYHWDDSLLVLLVGLLELSGVPGHPVLKDQSRFERTMLHHPLNSLGEFEVDLLGDYLLVLDDPGGIPWVDYPVLSIGFHLLDFGQEALEDPLIMDIHQLLHQVSVLFLDYSMGT